MHDPPDGTHLVRHARRVTVFTTQRRGCPIVVCQNGPTAILLRQGCGLDPSRATPPPESLPLLSFTNNKTIARFIQLAWSSFHRQWFPSDTRQHSSRCPSLALCLPHSSLSHPGPPVVSPHSHHHLFMRARSSPEPNLAQKRDCPEDVMDSIHAQDTPRLSRVVILDFSTCSTWNTLPKFYNLHDITENTS